jgi:2,3-bisphosphoglycerate-independent phosphoglycerate mutase
MSNNKVALIILDGYGYGEDYEFNAVTRSNSPFLHKHLLRDPSLIETSGEDVGLPAGTMGGSEVGHYTIGAGRVVNQALHRINEEIKTGSLARNKNLIDFIKKSDQQINLVGMISDAGVHSDIKHIQALVEIINQVQPELKIQLHAISDGRDVAEKSVTEYLKYLENIQKQFPQLIIGSLIGRFYAMDRDKNLERTEEAFNLIFKKSSTQEANIYKNITQQYENGTESDYYLNAIQSVQYTEPTSNQGFIFFNFRTDRASQLSQLISERNSLLTFGDYCPQALNLFPNQEIKNNLGETLAVNNKKQLRVAETEKYAHVTFFFNSQNKQPYTNEERVMIQSSKVNSYKDKPEMNASNITEIIKNKIDSENFDFILINYANPDLVGHSGSFEATIKSIECLDKELSILAPFLKKLNYDILITADHGNAEYMKNQDGSQNPSHTLNPVPLCLMSNKNLKLRKKGGLKDIAPTVLELLNIQKPEEMTGNSLLIN